MILNGTDMEVLQVLVAACTGVERGSLRVDAVDRLANWINQQERQGARDSADTREWYRPTYDRRGI